MTAHKAIVQAYFEGFRRSDHAAILALLTDDVAWHIPGLRNLNGKEAFDSEIENPDFQGSPKLTIDRLIEEGDTIVVIGNGEGNHRTSGPFCFAFCDVFDFRGELIAKVESYLTPLPIEPGSAL